ncbi:hypothetical protein IQ37_07170 [Chryseobacterium piperi]|uniref:Uncharacterized protein n=1 Tax=Chryseobacterium piperi TaxID=558152 RepID=A0A086BJI7_9FLAO|nr:DUF6624 domain-containing protein [Chryseobacterium piperi]ASW76398.1 hypothetical protein CJF12_06600 [Chryseobacterium piperi]KFF29101.1 hypothetical protein IQ37_07170 [Chryseobacterium piperi]
MNYQRIAQKIFDLKNADLELRDRLVKEGEIGEGYDEEMEKLHNENAKSLNSIIETIGYPTIDKVGKEASEAAWLIIQHSIGQPSFMKKCAELLKNAVDEQKADVVNLAYLTDRIAVLEGRSQLYGTQFDWNENGELVPNPFDDVVKVNKRRQSIGMNTLEEQTSLIQDRAKKEKHTPPKDFDRRKAEMEKWKKKAGWDK